MYCNKCQRTIDDAEATFCPECGIPLVPGPFAEDMPPAESTQIKDTAVSLGTQPFPGPTDNQSAAETERGIPSEPIGASVQQSETRASYAAVDSDTTAFAAINNVSSTTQMPSPPVLSPPPLHTGERASKRRGTAIAFAQKNEGVPVALVVMAAILFVLVASFVFLWLYFDLDTSDLVKIISKDRALSESTTQYGDEGGVGKSNGSLKTGNNTGTGNALPTSTPRPTEPPRAEPTDSTVVLRNAHPNARLLVNGVDTSFKYVGDDIVVQRSDLPDVCQIVLVAENDGTYEMATSWYNYQYGNELFFAGDYGDYVLCDASGLGKPSTKFIDALLWAYHKSFLRAINEQSSSYLQYSTEKNTYEENNHVYSTANASNTYDLDNFSVGCDPDSVSYSNEGKITLNATFVSYATKRKTGNKSEIISRKTLELIWENGMWKVNRLAFVNDNDYAAGRYADLP